jgi:hypothetical protein
LDIAEPQLRDYRLRLAILSELAEQTQANAERNEN